MHSQRAFLQPAIQYIQSLVNVQQARFITSHYRIKRLLKVNEWQEAIRKCVQLDRVILQLVDDIQHELRAIRPGIIFRVEKRLV